MTRLFFNICSFTALKVSPMAFEIYQSRFKILPNTKFTLKILPKTLKILPKRRNFAKSSHTGPDSPHLASRHLLLFTKSKLLEIFPFYVLFNRIFAKLIFSRSKARSKKLGNNVEVQLFHSIQRRRRML